MLLSTLSLAIGVVVHVYVVYAVYILLLAYYMALYIGVAFESCNVSVSHLISYREVEKTDDRASESFSLLREGLEAVKSLSPSRCVQ